jgi:hypothetical protein
MQEPNACIVDVRIAATRRHANVSGTLDAHTTCPYSARCSMNTAERSMVPRRGLEPPRVAPLEPESSASTNSATSARNRKLLRRPAGRRTLPRA